MTNYKLSPVHKNCIQQTTIIKKTINNKEIKITKEILYKWGNFNISLDDDEYWSINKNASVFNLDDFDYELNYLDFALDNFKFEGNLSEEEQFFIINNFDDLEEKHGFTIDDEYYEIFDGIQLEQIY